MHRRIGWVLALAGAAACGAEPPPAPMGSHGPATTAAPAGSTTTILSGIGATGQADPAAGVPPAAQATPVAGPYEKLMSDAEAEFGDDYAGFALVDAHPTVFTRDANGHRLFEGANVRVVEHSLRELKAAKDQLDSFLDEAIREEVPFHSARVDIRANRLAITLVEPSGSTSAPGFVRGRRIIEAKLGPAPVVWRASTSPVELL